VFRAIHQGKEVRPSRKKKTKGGSEKKRKGAHTGGRQGDHSDDTAVRNYPLDRPGDPARGGKGMEGHIPADHRHPEHLKVSAEAAIYSS